MSRRAWPWLVALLLVLVASLWLGGTTGAVASALSRDADGWLAARRYLEGRGAGVVLHDGPLTALPGGDVLVLTFPWQHRIENGEREALGRFLRRGNTVLLAYSGRFGAAREAQILETLQLEPIAARPRPPLTPGRWWAYQNATWELTATEVAPGLPPIRLGALRAAPAAPAGARVLYRRPDGGTPLVFDYPLHGGRVVALPAALLSNARIAAAGNADLLESLLGWNGERWIFDEFHHGLIGAEALPETTSRFAWDLFIGHLTLIYILGLAALARRFGPSWQAAPVVQGSTSSFLRDLGTLHHDLDHHRDAARLLLDRARAYEPRLSFDETLSERARQVADARGLVELATDVAKIQQRR